MRSSSQNVLLPDLAKAVLFEPCPELIAVKPHKYGLIRFTIYNNNIVRLKVIQKGAGLRANQNLSIMRCFSEQCRDHVERIRMKTQFWLIHNNQVR